MQADQRKEDEAVVAAAAATNAATAWRHAFDEQRFVQMRPAPSSTNAAEEAHATDEGAAAVTTKEANKMDSFCVYLAGPKPSAAASSASSSAAQHAAAAAAATSMIDAAAAAAPAGSAALPFVALLLHGGGHSSLAWACVASHLKTSMHVLAFDLRGHGHTHTQSDNELSMSRLVSDVIGVVRQVYSRPPPLLVIGHSLGGALAVHVAASKQLPVCGLCMVDLVEGTAVDSLSHMSAIVSSRPSAFLDHASAVNWALRSGALRNVQSARYSMPDQLVESVLTHAERVRGAMHDEAREGGVAASPALVAAMASAAPMRCYRWRTDLLASERYWSGWFAGLSALFLSCPAPKLLILASADRLDPPLMVAQMQGKLQVDVVGNTGHSVQEDQPQETARRIAHFANRHKFNAMAATWAKTNAATPKPAAATMTLTPSAASGAGVAVAATSVSRALLVQDREPHALAHAHAPASSLSPPPTAVHSHSAGHPAVPSADSAGHPRPPVPLFHE